MKKNKKALVEKYMYDSLDNEAIGTIEERYYTYGYMDGYFSEHIYIKQFLMDINEYHSQEYNLGFLDGVNEKINARHLDKLKKEKEEFFKKLAVHDAVVKVERRVLSSEKKYPVYHDYRKQAENIIIDERQNKKSSVKIRKVNKR